MFNMKKMVKLFKNSWLDIKDFDEVTLQFYPSCLQDVKMYTVPDAEINDDISNTIEGNTNITWWDLLENLNTFEFSMKNFGNVTQPYTQK